MKLKYPVHSGYMVYTMSGGLDEILLMARSNHLQVLKAIWEDLTPQEEIKLAVELHWDRKNA